MTELVKTPPSHPLGRAETEETHGGNSPQIRPSQREVCYREIVSSKCIEYTVHGESRRMDETGYGIGTNPRTPGRSYSAGLKEKLLRLTPDTDQSGRGNCKGNAYQLATRVTLLRTDQVKRKARKPAKRFSRRNPGGEPVVRSAGTNPENRRGDKPNGSEDARYTENVGVHFEIDTVGGVPNRRNYPNVVHTSSLMGRKQTPESALLVKTERLRHRPASNVHEDGMSQQRRVDTSQRSVEQKLHGTQESDKFMALQKAKFDAKLTLAKNVTSVRYLIGADGDRASDRTTRSLFKVTEPNPAEGSLFELNGTVVRETPGIGLVAGIVNSGIVGHETVEKRSEHRRDQRQIADARFNGVGNLNTTTDSGPDGLAVFNTETKLMHNGNKGSDNSDKRVGVSAVEVTDTVENRARTLVALFTDKNVAERNGYRNRLLPALVVAGRAESVGGESSAQRYTALSETKVEDVGEQIAHATDGVEHRRLGVVTSVESEAVGPRQTRPELSVLRGQMVQPTTTVYMAGGGVGPKSTDITAESFGFVLTFANHEIGHAEPSSESRPLGHTRRRVESKHALITVHSGFGVGVKATELGLIQLRQGRTPVDEIVTGFFPGKLCQNALQMQFRLEGSRHRGGRPGSLIGSTARARSFPIPRARSPNERGHVQLSTTQEVEETLTRIREGMATPEHPGIDPTNVLSPNGLVVEALNKQVRWRTESHRKGTEARGTNLGSLKIAEQIRGVNTSRSLAVGKRRSESDLDVSLHIDHGPTSGARAVVNKVRTLFGHSQVRRRIRPRINTNEDGLQPEGEFRNANSVSAQNVVQTRQLAAATARNRVQVKGSGPQSQAFPTTEDPGEKFAKGRTKSPGVGSVGTTGRQVVEKVVHGAGPTREPTNRRGVFTGSGELAVRNPEPELMIDRRNRFDIARAQSSESVRVRIGHHGRKSGDGRLQSCIRDGKPGKLPESAGFGTGVGAAAGRVMSRNDRVYIAEYTFIESSDIGSDRAEPESAVPEATDRGDRSVQRVVITKSPITAAKRHTGTADLNTTSSGVSTATPTERGAGQTIVVAPEVQNLRSNPDIADEPETAGMGGVVTVNRWRGTVTVTHSGGGGVFPSAKRENAIPSGINEVKVNSAARAEKVMEPVKQRIPGVTGGFGAANTYQVGYGHGTGRANSSSSTIVSKRERSEAERKVRIRRRKGCENVINPMIAPEDKVSLRTKVLPGLISAIAVSKDAAKKGIVRTQHALAKVKSEAREAAVEIQLSTTAEVRALIVNGVVAIVVPNCNAENRIPGSVVTNRVLANGKSHGGMTRTVKEHRLNTRVKIGKTDNSRGTGGKSRVSQSVRRVAYSANTKGYLNVRAKMANGTRSKGKANLRRDVRAESTWEPPIRQMLSGTRARNAFSRNQCKVSPRVHEAELGHQQCAKRVLKQWVRDWDSKVNRAERLSCKTYLKRSKARGDIARRSLGHDPTDTERVGGKAGVRRGIVVPNAKGESDTTYMPQMGVSAKGGVVGLTISPEPNGLRIDPLSGSREAGSKGAGEIDLSGQRIEPELASGESTQTIRRRDWITEPERRRAGGRRGREPRARQIQSGSEVGSFEQIRQVQFGREGRGQKLRGVEITRPREAEGPIQRKQFDGLYRVRVRIVERKQWKEEKFEGLTSTQNLAKLNLKTFEGGCWGEQPRKSREIPERGGSRTNTRVNCGDIGASEAVGQSKRILRIPNESSRCRPGPQRGVSQRKGLKGVHAEKKQVTSARAVGKAQKKCRSFVKLPEKRSKKSRGGHTPRCQNVRRDSRIKAKPKSIWNSKVRKTESTRAEKKSVSLRFLQDKGSLRNGEIGSAISFGDDRKGATRKAADWLRDLSQRMTEGQSQVGDQKTSQWERERASSVSQKLDDSEKSQPIGGRETREFSNRHFKRKVNREMDQKYFLNNPTPKTAARKVKEMLKGAKCPLQLYEEQAERSEFRESDETWRLLVKAKELQKELFAQRDQEEALKETLKKVYGVLKASKFQPDTYLIDARTRRRRILPKLVLTLQYQPILGVWTLVGRFLVVNQVAMVAGMGKVSPSQICRGSPQGPETPENPGKKPGTPGSGKRQGASEATPKRTRTSEERNSAKRARLAVLMDQVPELSPIEKEEISPIIQPLIKSGLKRNRTEAVTTRAMRARKARKRRSRVLEKPTKTEGAMDQTFVTGSFEPEVQEF